MRIGGCTFELKNVAVMKHVYFNLTLGIDWLIQHQVSLVAVSDKLDLVVTDVVPKRNSLIVNGSPVTNPILDPIVSSVTDLVTVYPVESTVLNPVVDVTNQLVNLIIVPAIISIVDTGADPIDTTFMILPLLILSIILQLILS